MSKKWITLWVFLILICSFFWYFILQKDKIHYLLFDIPGTQMAISIPPVWIFIEEKYKDEGDGNCTIIAHEKIHREQYKRMWLFWFYYNYLSEYFSNWRFNENNMEKEANDKSCKK